MAVLVGGTAVARDLARHRREPSTISPIP